MKLPRKYLSTIGRKGAAKGGSAKVPKGFSTLTPEQRVEMAQRGVEARRKGKK